MVLGKPPWGSYRNPNNIVHDVAFIQVTANGVDFKMYCGVTYVFHEERPYEDDAPTCLFCVGRHAR